MHKKIINRSPASEITHFLEKGYLLFTTDDLKLLNEQINLDAYLDNISNFQRKLKHFFALERGRKQLFEAKNSDFNHELKSYFPGWWDEFSYNDRIAHVDYSPEYLMSNNYYTHSNSTLFEPPSNSLESHADKLGIECILPSQEGHELCAFFHENILKRVQKELFAEIELKLPDIKTLQCVMIYYDKDKILPKHTDEVFLSAHVGPTDEGLLIFPPDSDQPVPVTLNAGEVMLFFGREFKHEVGSLNKNIPSPLPHYAKANKGRLTMALSTFVESPR